ncbi:hypothetical protein L2E82_14697 [Cichorium intybus]|uniref:Uncharacterized protein n=1 Tax=Cichorium intybus TaxID=13427 RepID=A0ACB9F143_CICIN|nr:hypothetical protein L2E82_14697 [Cichorium intybus]
MDRIYMWMKKKKLFVIRKCIKCYPFKCYPLSFTRRKETTMLPTSDLHRKLATTPPPDNDLLPAMTPPPDDENETPSLLSPNRVHLSLDFCD